MPDSQQLIGVLPPSSTASSPDAAYDLFRREALSSALQYRRTCDTARVAQTPSHSGLGKLRFWAGASPIPVYRRCDTSARPSSLATPLWLAPTTSVRSPSSPITTAAQPPLRRVYSARYVTLLDPEATRYRRSGLPSSFAAARDDEDGQFQDRRHSTETSCRLQPTDIWHPRCSVPPMPRRRERAVRNRDEQHRRHPRFLARSTYPSRYRRCRSE